MLHLTKNLRRRAAILIAVVYAFCVLAPSGALAFAASPSAFHCMDGVQAAAAPAHDHGTPHDHADGAEHRHGQNNVPDHHSNKDGNPNAGTCCGVFCVSALAHEPDLIFGTAIPTSVPIAALANGLLGRTPSPLHRPPIA